MNSGYFSNITAKDLWFPILALILVSIRFLHFGELVDEPHSWRQCDTANYIWSFYQDGIDILHPSVCWMGGHKTTILEFPLPEAIISVFYKVFGPDLIWARLVFMAFFVGGVRYLYLTIKLFGGKELSQFACLFYLAFPLGIYYSRAIHVDFSAIFFAHAMLYHFMVGLKEEKWLHLLAGSLLGGIGFMIKSPYLFFLYLPLLAWIHHHRKWRYLFRNIYYFAIPAGIFIPWQMHVTRVNSAAPDWDFIPHYKKFVDMWGWYFGTWDMRLEGVHWESIYLHIRFEILSFYGWWPFLAGILVNPRSFRANFVRLWLLGAIAYVAIFFNLNFVHNYYQLPLMAPIALCLGLLFINMREYLGRLLPRAAVWIVLLPILVFGWRSWQLTEQIALNSQESFYFQHYYRLPPVPIAGGQAIREHTPENSLVISSYGGLDCRAPMILYRAKRNGWSIPQATLTPYIIEQLRGEGAEYFTDIPLGPLPDTMFPYLDQFPHTTYPIKGLDLKLDVYKLK